MIKLIHDGALDIAIGKHRYASRWQNKKTSWSKLVNRFSSTHRTAETYKDYESLKKGRQDEIKDVGGFVGGYLTFGLRNHTSVMHRQILTLDIDFADLQFWETFTLMYSEAAVLYSTHKHSSKSPRFRLIMPISREVAADEYQAIARKIADIMNIELFDPTTYQVERLMYWPSTSSDGEFVFHYQDGLWLDADDVLSTYVNWKDSSEWPVSQKEEAVIIREAKKQGDPLDKPGLIGAFCRAYTIHDVIDRYLGEVYEACDMEGRYSYKEGSTSAGLVVYDDKFAYSHHGTDPISGKLCNAFDLVRIHLYGLNDDKVSVDTPVTKYPSYTAMQELAAKDGKVRVIVGRERLESAINDFKDLVIEDEDGLVVDEDFDTDWMEKLDVDKKGNYFSTINNVVIILQNDPHLKGCFAFDRFMQRDMIMRHVPWRRLKKNAEYFTESDEAGLRHYLERIYTISSAPKINDGLRLVLNENSYHPVQDYIKKALWDGKPRIETLLIDYMGAEDSIYVRAVTRKTLTAAVARIFRPGCKFEYVLTLVGEEGKLKSSLFDTLGGEWFSDTFLGVDGKEAYEQLQGVWIMEIPELAGFRRSESEEVKKFIGKRVDQYRPAYQRRTEIFPRQVIFVGTTNDKDFLTSQNGNRRFWPVDIWVNAPIKNVFDDLNQEERAQIWAEALHYYEADEMLYLSADVEEEAKSEQRKHTERDDRAALIKEYLEMLVPSNWKDKGPHERYVYMNTDAELREKGKERRNKISVMEIWCELFGREASQLTKNVSRDLHNIMRNMPGWHDANSKTDLKLYGTQRYYKRNRQ